MDSNIQSVIAANIALHSKMSEDYSTCEPHFRPENIAIVEHKIKTVIEKTNGKKLLDLGCGTGFVINIAKKYVDIIHGVDVTQAMMDKVDKSGTCDIQLFNHDTGTFPAEASTYDVVTGYSFLHHLYDVKPTLNTAFNALKKGGVAYFDLDPNFYFWDDINHLNRLGDYDEIIKREIEMVTYKDEDIEKNFGVDKDIFNTAEYGKNIKGGFKADELEKLLYEIGFTDVKMEYHWFVGQGKLINDDNFSKDDRFAHAKVMSDYLQKAMPLTKNLFKYIGFTATK